MFSMMEGNSHPSTFLHYNFPNTCGELGFERKLFPHCENICFLNLVSFFMDNFEAIYLLFAMT